MKNFKKTTLNNGLRLITIPQEDAPAATVFVLVNVGSEFETKEINGISHFLEHMCFKGTKKRPKQIEIARELESMGAEYNAFTSQEITAYYAKVKKGSLNNAIDVVSDMYLNPLFREEEIEKERGVIIEEINMYEDIPQRRVGEIFMNLVYGDQPAGWSIAGEKEVIKRLRRSDFLKYRNFHYVPGKTVVAIAGGFDEEGVKKQIISNFGKAKPGKVIKKLKTKEKQTKPRELIRFKETDQTHVVIGFRAFDIFDKRRFALEILADVLGGGISSRLFQKIRSDLGAAYYVRASSDLYSDHGVLDVSAGIQTEKVDRVIRAAMKEFKRIKDKKVSQKELKKSKEYVTGKMFLSLETSDSLAGFYGVRESLGQKFISHEDVAEGINKVTPDEVMGVARDILRNERLNLAAIGPAKNKSFLEMLKV